MVNIICCSTRIKASSCTLTSRSAPACMCRGNVAAGGAYRRCMKSILACKPMGWQPPYMQPKYTLWGQIAKWTAIAVRLILLSVTNWLQHCLKPVRYVTPDDRATRRFDKQHNLSQRIFIAYRLLTPTAAFPPRFQEPFKFQLREDPRLV